MSHTHDLSLYLEPTYLIDSTSPVIIAYSNAICLDKGSNLDRAIALFYGVRDDNSS